MPVLPQFGPPSGKALSSRQPAPAAPTGVLSSAAHGTQAGDKMKETSDEKPQEVLDEKTDHESDVASKNKPICFVHPITKDNAQNIPSEKSSTEESDSCSVHSNQSKKEEEGSDSNRMGSKKVTTEKRDSSEAESASDESGPNERDSSLVKRNIVKIKTHQKVPKSLISPTLSGSTSESNSEEERQKDQNVRGQKNFRHSRLSHENPESELHTDITKDNDKENVKDSPIITNQPAVASAAFTALFSAFSPLTQRGETNENQADSSKLQKKKRRMFYKVPNEDAVIVPLYGSSDEEGRGSNEDAFEEDRERNSSPDEDSPNKYSIIVPLQTSSHPQTSIVDEGDGLIQSAITPTSDIVQTRSDVGSQLPELISTEEDTTDRTEGKERTESAISEKTPLQTIHRIHSESELKENESKREEQANITQPTVVTAAHTTLSGAISPLAEVHEIENVRSEQPSNEFVKGSVTKKAVKKKRRIFKKVPNENAVIVPLHSSSEEDVDSSEIINEQIISKGTEVNQEQQDPVEYSEAPNEYAMYVPLHENNTTGKIHQEEFISRHGPDEYAVTHQTIASAAFSTLFPVFSPLVVDDKSGTTTFQGQQNNTIESKNTKPKQRIFKKVPNQNAVYIPLHGSSDEEEKFLEGEATNDLSEEETLTQTAAPNEYAVYVPLHNEENDDTESPKREHSELNTDEDYAISHPSISSAAFSSARLFSAFSQLGGSESSSNVQSESDVIDKTIDNETFTPLRDSSKEVIVSNVEEKEMLGGRSNRYENTGDIPKETVSSDPLNDFNCVVHDTEAIASALGDNKLTINQPSVAAAAYSALFSACSPLGTHHSATNEDILNQGENETDDKTALRRKPKIFKKVPNENAVYVPLHSSSEEDLIKGEDCSEGGQTESPVDPRRYSIYVALNDSSKADETEREKNTEQLDEGKKEENPRYHDGKVEIDSISQLQLSGDKENLSIGQPAVATAAFTALFSAFSPLGSHETTNSEGTLIAQESEENHSETTKPPKRKQKIFKKVPNENAVYIPLHSSSSEDLPEGEDSSESNELGEILSSEGPRRYSIYVPLHDNTIDLPNQENMEREENNKPNEEEIVVNKPTAATAALTAMFSTFAPFTNRVADKGDTPEELSGTTSENLEKTNKEKRKHRIFKKVPNENAVFVPLHGSSDEDVSQEEEIESERKVSEIKQRDIPKTIEYISDEPNKYAVYVPLHSEQEETTKTIYAVGEKHLKGESNSLPKDKENVLISQPSIATAAFTALYSASFTRSEDNVMSENISENPTHHEEVPSESIEKSTNLQIHPNHEDKLEVKDNEETEQKEVMDGKIEISTTKETKLEEGLMNITQPTIATAAFTSLLSTLSPLGAKEEGDECTVETSEDSNKLPLRRKPRIFKKVPNKNAVYVPLHSSSEEDDTFSPEGSELLTNDGETENEDSPAPNEYKIFVPLKDKVEENKTTKKSLFKIKEKKGKDENKEVGITQPTIATAAFTSLFSAFSPLGSTEQQQDVTEKDMGIEDKPFKRKQFRKLSNENAFFIPLQSSTDEEDKLEEEAVNESEIRKSQDKTAESEADKIGDHVEIRNKLSTINGIQDEPKKKEVTINEDENIEIIEPEAIELSQPTVATAAFTALFSAFSPLGKADMADKSEQKVEECDQKENLLEVNEKKEKSATKSILKRPKNAKDTIATIMEQANIGVQPSSERNETVTKSKSQQEIVTVTQDLPMKVTIKEVDSSEIQHKIINNNLEATSIKEEENQSVNSAVKPAQPTKEDISCDHEYEPIQVSRAASQPNVRSQSFEKPLKPKEEDRYETVKPQEVPLFQETTPNLQTEGGYEIIEEPKKEQRRCIKIPNEDAIIVPLHGSSDEEINPDRYQNPALMLTEEEIENFPRQPLPFVNILTSDDMANLPPTHHETFQEKLRTQADRFTTKLKGISKPKMNIHKPKIKLPERPNIKMPEIPMIKLPERPRFNLPDRSKFHLPERSRFHLPDRSKFHLPEKPKFLTERPKFKLPERFTHHDKKPKGPKVKKPNPSSLRRPLRDVVTVSSQSTPGSTHNIFETLKFRTYPRFLKKKRTPPVQKMSSLDTESSQPSTPPRRPRRFSDQQQDTSWVHAYDRDIRFADEETNLRVERMEEEYEREENTAPFHEHFDGGVVTLEEDFKQAKAESMTSVVSEKGSSGSSSNRRRAGVIEEIDSDEFFVRQKGLSREDVAVSRYLSMEIRDAFRQPKNALASLDNEMYDDEDQDVRFEHIPRAPVRSKSQKSASADREKECHTFPKRPSRRKESDPEVVVKPPRRFRSKSGSRYRSRQSSMPSLSAEPDQEAAPEAPRRKSRERSIRSLNREGRTSDLDIVQTRMTAHHSGELPPVAPLRKSRSRGTSLADDDRTSRGADSTILPDDDDEVPHPSRRRIEPDEEATMEDDIEVDVEEIIEEDKPKPPEHAPTQESLHVYEGFTDHSGYAVVSKTKNKPPRPPPLPHQPFDFHSQIDNIKTTGKNIFFTYPRRAIKSLHKPLPSRPTRKYNTLGPVRPPRRNRVFRKPVYMTGDVTTQQDAFGDKERDLQSGEVVSRMKGRPLPAPPRPPRKSRDYDVLIGEMTESSPPETIIAPPEVAEKRDETPEPKESRANYLKTKKDEFLKTISKFTTFEGKKEDEPKDQTSTAQKTSLEVGEVSVSIQTDPLPKDVIVIDQEIEETQEILILSDNTSREYLEEKFETQSKTSPVQLKERRVPKEAESKEPEEENSETNIFKQALERVEAAKGVLKEARERVIPGSTTSLEERKPSEESESILSRVPQRESLPASSSRSVETEKEDTPPPLPARPHYTKPIPVSFPDKLHISELDVDKLNVSEIQANKIKVSEIESTCIEVTELTSQGGHFTLNGLELPPDFISNVVAQVTSQVESQVREQVQSLQVLQEKQALQTQQALQAQQTLQEQHATQMQQALVPHQQLQAQQIPQPQRESTPQRQMRRVLTPPPPIIIQASVETVSLPEPKVPETQATQHIPQPRTTKSKGRRSPTRVIDDSEDELASIMPQRREREKKAKQKSEKTSIEDDPVVPGPEGLGVGSGPTLRQASSFQLLGRLISIWYQNIVEGGGTFVQGVNALFPEGEKRRDAQIAAVILLILITGLILIGFGFDNSVHHHHWDYLPPR